MNEDEDRRQRDNSIHFFGKVTASISHEMKNVMAIINENAGLIEDLALMAEKGRPLDVKRVKTLAGKIRVQVQRGDGIVRNMNRFAHSIDIPVDRVDLCELLELMVMLAQHAATMKSISLEAKAAPDKIIINTRPFILENLIWFCLMSIMGSDPSPRTIIVVPESVLKKGVQVRFTGFYGHPLSKDNTFLKQAKEQFLKYLEGDLIIDSASDEIVIVLPGNISAGS